MTPFNLDCCLKEIRLSELEIALANAQSSVCATCYKINLDAHFQIIKKNIRNALKISLPILNL